MFWKLHIISETGSDARDPSLKGAKYWPWAYRVAVQGKWNTRIWKQTNNLHHNRRGQQKLARDRKLF